MEHIAQHLKNIYFSRTKGQLFFRHEHIQKFLFFQDGKLVYARTNQPDEFLGEVLFRLGKITEDVFKRIDEYIDPMKSIGENLIQNDLISRADLLEGLQMQMREITLKMFSLFDGIFKFQEKETLPEDSISASLDIPILIEEGIRRMKYDERLKEYLSYTVPFPKERKFYFRLTEAEKDIYEIVRGEKSAQSLLSEHGFHQGTYWKSLYLFYCLNIIDVKAADVTGSAQTERPAADELEPETGPEPVIEPEPAAGPEPEARPKTPVTEKKPPQPSPGAPPQESASDDKSAEKKVNDVLAFHDSLSGLNYYEVLDVPHDAEAADIKKSYFLLAKKYHPDLFSRDLSEEAKEKIDAVFDKITKIYQTLSDEKKRAAYDKELQSSTGETRRDALRHAEVKFRQGKTLYDQGRYQEALMLVEEAVRINPEKGNYFVLLALTESKFKDYQRKAIRSYQKAIQLDPWSSQGYLGLGALYKRNGMPSLAAKQFKKAMQVDPGNKIAERELRDIEEGDKKKGFMDILSSFSKSKKK